MIMSKLGPAYDLLTQRINGVSDLEQVDLDDVEKSIRLAWEQRVSKHPPPNQAAKISAVKPNPGEPSFSGQQQGEGSKNRRPC